MSIDPRIIRAGSRGSPIAGPQNGAGLELVYFDLIRLSPGEQHVLDVPGFEIHLVPMSGRMDVEIDGNSFTNVGDRDSVWDGNADSVYGGSGVPIRVRAITDLELAVAGGATDGRFDPFRVLPGDVQCVEVGSSETKSRRRICHLLGQNAAGRAGNLLVSELYAEEGCWSGYPPHKHDTDRSEEDGDGNLALIETDHQELYHYRYRPDHGFGVQISYRDRESPGAEMIRSGDTFLIPDGYHPTVTSPGHEEYIFTVLVGRTRRGLVQHFEPAYSDLIGKIPGISGMRKAFERVIEAASGYRLLNLRPCPRPSRPAGNT